MMNNTSICIFVTSDNINVTKTLVEKLEEKNIPLVHIVYNDYDDSDWHSGKLIEDSKSSIDNDELQKHPELVEWEIAKSAKEAIYHEHSTYAKTARMSKGPTAQFHDQTYLKSFDNCNIRNVKP